MRWGLVVVVLLAGCGDEEDDAGPFCDTVERLPSLLADAPSDLTLDEMDARIAEIDEWEADLRELAPDAISDEVATLFDYDAGTLRVSEREEAVEARDRVNGFIREECDLAVEL